MRGTSRLSITFLLALSASGFSADAFPGWVSLDGKAAEGNAVGKDKLIREVKTPVMRVMRAAVDAPKGTVLIFPSGGYQVLSIVSDGTDKAAFWNAQGYDAAILEYSISGPKPAAIRDVALKDALAAVALVRERGKDLGLHGGRFILMGGSAGAHLATRAVAALAEKDRPDTLVLFYPAYLQETPADGDKPGMPVPAGKLPALFVAIAANDNGGWVNGARTYAQAWEKAGGTASFNLYEDGGHGFHSGTKAAKDWPQRLTDFASGPVKK